jgi:hypothetical protein
MNMLLGRSNVRLPPGRRAARRAVPPRAAAERTTADAARLQQLRELGYSEEEAKVEAAVEEAMTEVDPEATTLSFEDLYRVDEGVPDDVREALLAPGHGPPVRSCSHARARARA